MRNALFPILALLTFILAATYLYPLGFLVFRPDLQAVFVFYLARTRKFGEGLVLAGVTAILFSSFHNGFTGLFLLQALLLFSSIRVASRLLNLSHPFFVAAYLFGAEIVLQLFYWFSYGLLTGIGPFHSDHFAFHPVPIAGMTALVAPWIYLLLLRIEKKLAPRREDVFLLR